MLGILEFQYSYSPRWIVSPIETDCIFLSDPGPAAIFVSLADNVVSRQHSSLPLS